MPLEPTHQVSTPLCHFYHHISRNYTTPSLAINKKLKQMSLSVECVAFLWPLCEWSHRAVNGQASDKECMGRIFTPLTVMLIQYHSKRKCWNILRKQYGLQMLDLMCDKYI